jgi:phospholipase C
VLSVLVVLTVGTTGTLSNAASGQPARFPGGYKHLVVIYMENHSFDNLYGQWGDVDGQHVRGLSDATAAQWTQRSQNGSVFTCLLQNDVNLTSPPLAGDCAGLRNGPGSAAFLSHFPNQPFAIDDYIAPEDLTCPKEGVNSGAGGVPKQTGEPGGCTRDLVHRFYQEQYQIHGGQMDRYTHGSDAAGLTMGYYRTQELPIWKYLNGKGAPNYVIADNFFQAAFGGSFLNHQWLIAARTPYDDPTRPVPDGRLRTRTSVVDTNGMPVVSYPLYRGLATNVDGEKTVATCPGGAAPSYAIACGDWVVNTAQPSSPPYSPNANARFMPLIDDDVFPNIGDRMTEAGITWNWYAGRWDAVNSGGDAPLFQYHHQPFVYFEDYAPGTPGRAHLRDETEFVAAAEAGTLPTVSFVKPYAEENEHPGYASASRGSARLVELIRAVTEGGQAGNTLVVVTYDEFGGQWDHVSPPTDDAWGPGTRIPALVIGRSLTRSGVDHTQYDTTSILATIERSLGLEPLSDRDATVNDLAPAVAVGGR